MSAAAPKLEVEGLQKRFGGLTAVRDVSFSIRAGEILGLILQASGQDPVQAGALGFNVTKHKLAAFLVSAFFSGLAGALMAFYLGAASVGTFIDVTVGVQVIIGAVIGGRRTILGAALGAVFLVALGESLRPLGDLATFIVSAVALLVVLVFPAGLLGMDKGVREAT